MGKTILLFALFTSLLCNAQSVIILTTGDTLHGKAVQIDKEHTRIETIEGKKTIALTSMIKSINKDIAYHTTETAGDNLIQAAEITFASAVIVILGTAIVAAGIFATPAIAIVGSAIVLAGGIYSITAWKKIKNAGEILKINNL